MPNRSTSTPKNLEETVSLGTLYMCLFFIQWSTKKITSDNILWLMIILNCIFRDSYW